MTKKQLITATIDAITARGIHPPSNFADKLERLTVAAINKRFVLFINGYFGAVRAHDELIDAFHTAAEWDAETGDNSALEIAEYIGRKI